jgi:transposase-like protein
MAGPAKKMAAEEFDHVAEQCRWSKRNLDAVRALLVDGADVGEIAGQFNVTTSYLWNYKTRFLDKAAQSKAKEFMRRQSAAGATTAEDEALKPFHAAIVKLSENGYSDQQIAEFLAENDVTVSDTAVRHFLDIHRGQK